MAPDPHLTPLRIRNEAALGRHLAASLRQLWRAYRKRLARCQSHFSERSVHDLRVVTRRLLSKLDLLSAILREQALDKARRTLKKRLDVFDDLRDTQVQLRYVGKIRRSFPELAQVKKALERLERRWIKRTGKKVKRLNTAKLARALTTVRRRLDAAFSMSAARARSTACVQRAVRQTFSRVMDLKRRIDPTDTATIHRTRIAFKNYRYMVESLGPVLSSVRRARLEQMHDYQTAMGEIQDTEMLLARLDRLLAKKSLPRKPLMRLWEVLARQRSNQVKDFMKSADLLDGFWPEA